MSYEERLRYLKLHSLKRRQLRGDLIRAYTFFQGIDDIAPKKLLPIAKYRGTRNQGQKFRYRHARTDIIGNIPLQIESLNIVILYHLT